MIGNIHLINLFLPLVRKSPIKKVIALSTGLADLDLTNAFDIESGALYAASKAALNMIVAKFAAQYSKTEGILFLAVSPGLVDVGKNNNGEFVYPRYPHRNSDMYYLPMLEAGSDVGISMIV